MKDIKKTLSKKLFPFVLMLLCGLSWTLVSGSIGRWSWEAPLQPGLGAMRVPLSSEVRTLSLTRDYWDAEDNETQFAIALTREAVREFWLFDDGNTHEGVISCGKGEPRTEAKVITCWQTDKSLVISVPPPDDVSGNDKDKRATNRRRRLQDLWLIPQQPSEFTSARPVSLLRWAAVKLQLAGEKVIQQDAASCINPSSETDRSTCDLISATLDRPQLTFMKDPQRYITGFAKFATTQLIPAVVYLLLIVCACVFIVNAVLVCLWILGNGLVERPVNGLIIDAETVWSGARRLLYALEILGPAIGFTMTVLGLMIAFDRQAFGEQNRSLFGSAISAALSVTFCGLVLRLLSFTADRLIEHLSHWNADPSGMIYAESHPLEGGQLGGDISKPGALASNEVGRLQKGRD